jgi:hypothetical protein
MQTLPRGSGRNDHVAEIALVVRFGLLENQMPCIDLGLAGFVPGALWRRDIARL